MALLDLPTEVIALICRAAPLSAVINLRLVSRCLNDKITHIFLADNFATLEVVPDDQMISMRLAYQVATEKATATCVRHLCVHTSYILHRLMIANERMSRSYSYDLTHKKAKLISLWVKFMLTRLMNCQTVEITDGIKICPQHHYPHFQGRKTYTRSVSEASTRGYIQRVGLSHQHMVTVVFKLLTTIAEHAKTVQNVVIGPQIALQDIRANLLAVPCKGLYAENVRSLRLHIIDCSDEHFRVHFWQKHLRRADASLANHMLKNDGGAEGEHECQLSKVGPVASPWERKSSRHTMLRCFLSHFPSLRELDLDIEVEEMQEPVLVDMMPAFLANNALRILTLSAWIGDGVTLTRAIQGMESLEAIALRECVFGNLEAFKHTIRGFLRLTQYSLRGVRLHEPSSYDKEGRPVMICPGDACEPFLCRCWGSGGLTQQVTHVALNPLSSLQIWLEKCHLRVPALTMDQEDLVHMFADPSKLRSNPIPSTDCTASGRSLAGTAQQNQC